MYARKYRLSVLRKRRVIGAGLAASITLLLGAASAQAQPAVPLVTQHNICYNTIPTPVYCLNYPGHNFQVSTTTAGAAANYQPINSSTFNGHTYYQWEAGTTGYCLAWDSTDGGIYLRTCGTYPAAEAWWYGLDQTGGLAYMVNEQATVTLGNYGNGTYYVLTTAQADGGPDCAATGIRPGAGNINALTTDWDTDCSLWETPVS